MTKNTAILILAAGSSSRLGSPKQLVRYKQKSLIAHTVETAIEASIGPVHVILGAYADDIIDHCKGANTHYNSDWKSGMGSSLSYGLSTILDAEDDVEGVLVLLCDQPYIKVSLLQEIVELGLQTKGIIISDYGTAAGPPSYFDKKYFAELMLLSGDDGAKQIVKTNNSAVSKVSFPEGIVDIDTPDDLSKLHS